MTLDCTIHCDQCPSRLTEAKAVWDNPSQMALEKPTRSRIIQALNVLGDLSEKAQVNLELCIYEGSAIILAYGARDATKAVDVVLRPSDIAKGLAAQVAERLGLDSDWLNDEVRQFVSEHGTFAPLEVEELEAAAKRPLKVTRPSAASLRLERASDLPAAVRQLMGE